MLLKNKVSVFFILALCGLIGYIIFLHYSAPKTGYVYIREIYNGFEMKKQMEQKFIKVKNSREKVLDSLKFELNALLKKIDKEKEKNPETIAQFETLRTDFLQKKTSFEEANTALTQQYDQEILTQLNQYVKDYGTQHKFSFLFGNDGNGSLMYGTEELNRTKEVLEFVNEKYNGIK